MTIPDTHTTIWEAHAEYRSHGAQVRVLYTEAYLDEAGALSRDLQDAQEIGSNEAIGRRMRGVYGEVAYDVLPLLFPYTQMSLSPFYRYSWLDTQDKVSSGLDADGQNQLRIHTVGLQFAPVPNVVLKANYRNFDPVSGDKPDEFELGFGLVF